VTTSAIKQGNMRSRSGFHSPISRRQVLGGAAGLPLVALALRGAAAAAEGLDLGEPQSFGFDWLRDQAKELAAKPYAPPVIRYADVLERIDYDAYQQIRFIPGHALWPDDDDGPYPIQFFHLGRFFKAPVQLHVVKDGQAQEILYSPSLFTFGKAEFAAQLPEDIGFAGFRVMDEGSKTDWLAFLGAAYFRSSGQLDQYGLSTRGIAIDTGLPTPEEFPRFTGFWFEPSAVDPQAVVIYALMDGPSIAGAYRMECAKHDGVVMQIEAALYARKEITRLGVAPLT